MKYDVFISYSRKDFKVVNLVVKKLQEAGLNVWIDEDGIESGDLFKKVITKAIENSSCLLFFSSFASNQSSWTAKEIGIANYENVPIITVLLDDAKYNPEIKFDLINQDFVNMKVGADYDQSIARILKSIQKLLPNTGSADSDQEQTEAPSENIYNTQQNLNSEIKDGHETSDKEKQPKNPERSESKKRVPANFENKIRRVFSTKKVYIIIFCLVIFFGAIGILGTYLSRNNSDSHKKDQSDFIESEEEIIEDAYTLLEKGWECEKTGDYRNAISYYTQAAEQGNDLAQFNLGFMYENGKGVTQNYHEAVQWYRKSAEQGYVGAQNNLAGMYYDGLGVTQNYNEAVKWYRQAAEQGSTTAQFNLGGMYYDGLGVTQNYIKAVKWFREAAEQGDADAQCALGLMYYYGDGVAKDYTEGRKWLQMAADQGHAEAIELLNKVNKTVQQ